jgi:RNA polymerase sigma-70 factor, ECF subfamily
MAGVIGEVNRRGLDDPSSVRHEPLDASTFGEYYDAYFPRLYTYIRYRVGGPAVADELVAQVFENALARLNRYNPDLAPAAVWLFAIARNVVTDHLRAQRRHRWVSLDVIRDWLSPSPPPDETIVARELHGALLDAIGRLTQRERDLIGLKFAGGHTNRRIAALTGLSESNVAVLVHRALQRLRSELARSGVVP